MLNSVHIKSLNLKK
uniref:Uncharacterized protein n=1 Tax=Anguilla anguilla TaxID=7936 RepID=A0A0E9PU99_ANGAN